MLLIFTQSYEYLCVLVSLLGFCFEAWFSIIWTLTYDWFSVSDAPDVSGILFFCRGIATLIVPAFQTLILEATASEMLPVPTQTAFFSANSTSSMDTSSPLVNIQDALTTMAPNETNQEKGGIMRSFGNQMVMTMLSGLLSLAIVCQIFMYFLVIKSPGRKKETKIEIDCGQTNNAFQ